MGGVEIQALKSSVKLMDDVLKKQQKTLLRDELFYNLG